MTLCKCNVWDQHAGRTRRCRKQALGTGDFCALHGKKCGSKWESPWGKERYKALLAGCRMRIRMLQMEVRRLQKMVQKPKGKSGGGKKKSEAKTKSQHAAILEALPTYIKGNLKITSWSAAERRAE